MNRIRTAETHHRAGKRDVRKTVGGEALLELKAKPDTVATAHVWLRLVIEESLELLPADHQKVVRLRIEGYEIAEIARHVRRSQRTVERMMQESRSHLKGLMYEHAQTE